MTTTTPPRGESAVTWARQHGTHVRGWFALDNYQPCPRETAYVDCYFYSTETAPDAVVIDGLGAVRDARRAVYLIDDGRTVRPFYVAAYHPDRAYVIAHAFPVDVNADGSPLMRADGRGAVDMSTWAIGPSRAYHVKVSGVTR